MAVIKEQLNHRNCVVIAGDPTLTEMALASYRELTAYSRLLAENPAAPPEQISPDKVESIKNEYVVTEDRSLGGLATCSSIRKMILLKDGTTYPANLFINVHVRQRIL